MIVIENVEETSNRKYSVRLKIVKGLDSIPYFKDYNDIAASTMEEAQNNACKLHKLEESQNV